MTIKGDPSYYPRACPFPNCSSSGVFNTQHGLDDHYRIHTNGFTNKCSLCNASFSRPITLNNHLNKVHGPNIQPVTCTICGVAFKNQSGLSRHMGRMHSDYSSSNRLERIVTPGQTGGSISNPPSPPPAMQTQQAHGSYYPSNQQQSILLPPAQHNQPHHAAGSSASRLFLPPPIPMEPPVNNQHNSRVGHPGYTIKRMDNTTTYPSSELPQPLEPDVNSSNSRKRYHSSIS